MEALAVFVAQLLDPVRIVALAILVWLSYLTSPTFRWLLIAGSAIIVAVVIPQALGHAGQRADLPTVVGLFSNAAIVAVVLGLVRVFRR